MNYQTYWWSPVSLCATCSFTVSFPLFRPPNLTSRAVRPMVTMITRLTNLIWKTLGMCPVSFLWPKNLVSKPASFASENKNPPVLCFYPSKVRKHSNDAWLIITPPSSQLWPEMSSAQQRLDGRERLYTWAGWSRVWAWPQSAQHRRRHP